MSYRVSAPSAGTLRLQLSRSLLGALRTAGRHGITVTVTVPGPGGRRVARTVRLTLRRPPADPARIPHAG